MEPLLRRSSAAIGPSRRARDAMLVACAVARTLTWRGRCGCAQTCTFRPQRLTPVTPPRAGADAASIKGMDKFTARQAEARRKRAQAEADAAAAEQSLLQVSPHPIPSVACTHAITAGMRRHRC